MTGVRDGWYNDDSPPLEKTRIHRGMFQKYADILWLTDFKRTDYFSSVYPLARDPLAKKWTRNFLGKMKHAYTDCVEYRKRDFTL